MADTGSDVAGQPWWVKAMTQFGVPAVLCVGLVYWVVVEVNQKLAAIAPLPGMVTAHVDATGRANAEMMFYVRQICIQNAIATKQKPSACNYAPTE